MLNTIKCYLHLSSDKPNNSGEYAIHVFVVLNGKMVKRVPTKTFINPKWWDSKAKEVKTKYIHASVLNERLQGVLNEVKGKMYKLQNQSGLTAQIVRDELAGKKSDSLVQFYRDHIDNSQKKYTANTLKKWGSEYIRLKNYDKDVTFGQINIKWLEKYETHCSETLNYNTSLSVSIRMLLEILRKADKRGLFDLKFISGYKRPSYKNPERRYLTLAQTEKIWELVTEGKLDHDISLLTVACFFLVECYAGVRFSDWGKIKVEKISKKEGLKVRTTKTGSDIFARLDKSPRLKAVLAYIKDNGLVFDLTEPHTNRLLKSIGLTIGLDFSLTSHIGRYTAATLMLDKGHDFEYVSNYLGVSLKTAQIYGKVTGVKMDKDYDKLGGL